MTIPVFFDGFNCIPLFLEANPEYTIFVNFDVYVKSLYVLVVADIQSTVKTSVMVVFSSQPAYKVKSFVILVLKLNYLVKSIFVYQAVNL